VKRKKWLLGGIALFLFILLVMIFTNPSETKFHQWIQEEYDLECRLTGQHFDYCLNDGKEMRLTSSAYSFKNTGIYSTNKRELVFENGDKIAIRVLGVFGMLFSMEDGKLWEILN